MTASALLLRVALLSLAAAVISATAIAHEPDADPHAAHRAQAAAAAAGESSTDTRVLPHQQYDLPDVTLVDSTGVPIKIRGLLASSDAVIVNFIFTSCTTICPVMTASLLQVQATLAQSNDGVQPHYVSISIDPNYDSVDVLRAYAKRFGADWTFLTGSHDDVVAVLRAFDVYRGNKLNHAAITVMRPAGSKAHWTRVEGLTTAAELARLWRDSQT